MQIGDKAPDDTSLEAIRQKVRIRENNVLHLQRNNNLVETLEI